VARYGGEEFVVVLPSCPTASAVETAERLRRAVAGVAAPDGKPITASLGVATFPFDGSDGGDLIRAADSALYQAKERGRNQVVVASTAEHA